MAHIAQRGEVVIIRQRLPEGARGGGNHPLISYQPALEIIDKCLSLRRRRAPAQPGTDKGGGKAPTDLFWNLRGIVLYNVRV